MARRPPAKMTLRLYVIAGAPNSIAARANLAEILRGMDPSDYALEVVDCIEQPQRALADGVIVTPTLLRMTPEPTRVIVGSLSDRRMVVDALDLNGTEGANGSDGGTSREGKNGNA